MKTESEMKSPAELQRAIHLLSILLSGQIKLSHPIPPDAILNTQGVVRALQWTMNCPDCVPLENLLRDIEKAMEEPGFNPHYIITE